MMNYLSSSQPQQQRDCNNKTKRRRGARKHAARRRNESVARNATGDKYPISILSIRFETGGLPFGTRMMLTIRGVRAGGLGVQTARYRVDNPLADGYKRRNAALSALERRNFERNYRCTYSHVRNRLAK